jgi:hypothetical protein
MFKMNLSFELILLNIETNDYRYFIAYHNEQVFDHPMQIERRADVERLQKKLAAMDITNYILRQRPNTKYKPVLVTNVHFTFTSPHTFSAPASTFPTT